MYFSRVNKIISYALSILLLIALVSTGTVASADNTAASAAQSSAPPSGSAPSGNAPSGGAPSGGSPSGGANTTTYDYNGTLTGALSADGQSVTSKQETYTASDTDQNAALVQNAGTLTISGDQLNKSGDDTNGDNCNFYGLNSILLAVNSGSTAYISDSTLNADSEGSNGIFATDNATVYANNDTISTTSDNSRGLDVTYGGTIIANLMNIITTGNHCASIASDRGGGSVSVANSTLSTAGSGSPLIYSTGDIQVDNVTGTAANSQIAGMEGLNTILINNSTLTSTMTKATASDPMADGIIIYQSTSGDAEATTGESATFQAVNSTLKSAITSGTMFYFTNTTANVVLSNTVLDFDSSNANLLTVQGNDSNSWGTAGQNGASVTFTGLDETLNGNIDVDTISSLDLYLLDGTTYTGATSISTNSVNTDVSSAPITINLDGTSKWVVTANSTVTNLNAESGSSIVDADGNTVSIIVDGSTVVDGTSNYTVTVLGSYSTSVTTGSSNELSTSYIDRTAFDEYYAVETSFGTSDTNTVSETAATATTEAVTPAEETESAATELQNETEKNHTALYVAIIAVVILGAALSIKCIRKKKKNKK